jgi:uncharacterized protein
VTAAELEGWAAKCRAFAEMVAGDAAHDLSHLERVVTSAVLLAKSEQACMEIVLPASWLHDCVSLPKDSPDRARASLLAGVLADDFLRKAEYPAEFLDPIRHCIEAHSFTGGIAPETLEAKIVQDADRLDALGAIGIARCFSVGGSLGRALYAKEDPFCTRRESDDTVSSVDHFFRKLFRIAGTMQTEAGRTEAERRVEFMRGYLEQLAREIGAGFDVQDPAMIDSKA